LGHIILAHTVATIDEDFKDDRVIVTLKHTYSDINASLTTDDFKVLDVKGANSSSVGTFKQSDISKIEKFIQIDDLENNDLVNKENFHQILSIRIMNPGKENVLAAISAFEELENVLAAEPDYILNPIALAAPNDIRYVNQTNLTRIGYEAAWDYIINNNITTSTVKAGVLEGNIDSTHNDLKANVISGNNSGSATSHATHVAGTIGADTDNSIGISGVGNGRSGRNVTKISSLSWNDFGAALAYAMNNGIPIINASMTYGSNFITSHANAIKNYNGLLICSAGNSGVSLDNTPQYPAAYNLPNMITVAATAQNSDTLASTKDWKNYSDLTASNWGANSVHIAAPGTGILSTIPTNDYEAWAGTSMAAPHVTGVVALVMSLRPDLTPLEVKSIVLNNTDDVSALNGLCVTGGRLNAYKAVLAARDYVSKRKMLIGDVNGDGKADYIMPWRRGNGKLSLVVFRGNATATGRFSEGLNALNSEHYYTGDENTRGADGYIADVNGDGCADYIMPWKRTGGYLSVVIFTGKTNGYFNEGINFHSQHYYIGSDFRGPDGYMGDINGDGYSDYVMPWKNGNNLSLAVFKGKASSSGGYFSEGINYHTYTAYEGGASTRGADGYLADVTGDGKADYIVPSRRNNDGLLRLKVYRGNASGGFNAASPRDSAHYYVGKNGPQAYVADVTGDGRADYVVPWKRVGGYLSLAIFKGTSTGVMAEGVNFHSQHYYTGDENNRGSDGYMADVNGDGRADYVMPWKRVGNYLSIVVFRGRSDGVFDEGVNFNSQHYYTGNIDTRGPDGCMAEVNGDGRADYIMPWKRAGGYLSLVTFRGKPDSSSGYFVNDGENFHSQHYYVGPN